MQRLNPSTTLISFIHHSIINVYARTVNPNYGYNNDDPAVI